VARPAFDRFRTLYNDERPHQALGRETPASRNTPSTRAYTVHPEPITEHAHFEGRLVSQNSTIRWQNRKVFVPHLLGRE
jgi:putative transposase